MSDGRPGTDSRTRPNKLGYYALHGMLLRSHLLEKRRRLINKIHKWLPMISQSPQAPEHWPHAIRSLMRWL